MSRASFRHCRGQLHSNFEGLQKVQSRKCGAESAEIWLPAFTSVRESEVAQMPIGDFEREAQTIQKRPLTDYVFKDLLTVSMVPFSRFK